MEIQALEELKTENKTTGCYTYEVSMVVQVLAKSKEEADEKLDLEGGFISKRDVIFKDVVSLYSGEDTDDNPKTEDK